mmetsp:Transcript_5086/g.10762  ORF Transcript_5086/g.10762 Transcript_5086/m.10762 type:complete len:180 (+) Transcript_5086:120-659(+)
MMDDSSMVWQWVSKARAVVNEVSREITQRDWRIPPRTWPEFVERFSMPKIRNPRAVWNRMYLNLNYYQTNYLIIYALALVMFLLRKPWSVLEVTAIVTGWSFATRVAPIEIYGRRITRNQRFGIMTVVSLGLPILTGIMRPLLVTFAIATVVVVLHSIARHSNVHHRAGEIRAQVNDKW